MTDTLPVPIRVTVQGRLSGEAMTLLCRLEHLNGQIARPKSTAARLDAIAVAQQMLVEIFEYSLQVVPEERDQCRETLAVLIEQIRFVEILLNEVSWVDFLRLSSELRQTKEQEYRKLGHCLEGAFRHLLGGMGEQIAESDRAAQWTEGYSAIIDDFIARW